MSMLNRVALGVVLCGAVVTVPVEAHHSFPATYFVDQKVEIEGTVVQFLFRNPHSFVHVMAPDKDGVMQRWAVEWGAGGALTNDNISSDTLKPGDKVKISGSPRAKSGRPSFAHEFDRANHGPLEVERHVRLTIGSIV